MADSVTVQRVRKLPVEVQAAHIERAEQLETVADWCGGSVIWEDADDNSDVKLPKALVVTTMEGPMRADVGWWIIKGVEGEFYPCASSVFDKSYEVL